MLGQFEDMIVNKLVQQLNKQGLNVDAETIKRAVANSPQIVQQIEGILLASTSQDRLAKITALIKQAAGEGGGTTGPTGTTQPK